MARLDLVTHANYAQDLVARLDLADLTVLRSANLSVTHNLQGNPMKTKACKRYDIPGHAHELTFSCYNQHPFFANPEYCDELIRSIGSARKKHQFDLWAYVIMPGHVHILIYPRTPEYSISGILKSIKQPVSQTVIRKLKQNDESKQLADMKTGERARPYRFWQAGGGYDRNFDSPRLILKAIDYIHNNPIRRGLVAEPGEWKYSSYNAWHNEGKGILDIDIESFPFS